MDAATLKTFQALMQTQSWARKDILAYQKQLLEKLCRHARAHVPFYRDGRLAPLFDRDDRFDMRRWEEVPVLTRMEAWRQRDAIQAERVPQNMEPLVPGGTTGSTGTPLPFRRTAPGRMMAEAQLARALTWRKLTGLNPVIMSKAVTGDHAGTESTLKPGAPVPATRENAHFVDFVLPPAEQAAQLRTRKPRLIITYPNIALSWIEAGYDFEGVRALVLTGECCSPEMRAAIEAGFPGPIVEAYSASEAGPIAMEGHTERGGAPLLNICEENVWLEGPGTEAERGRPLPLIITPFYSYGTPLIRYAPGDYVLFGRGLDREASALRRLERIVGRQRNMFRRPDGSGFWPNLSGVRLMAIARHTHRQLIQEEFGRFVMRIVFDAPPSLEQIAQIRAHVAEVTGGGDIVVEAVDSIPDDRLRGKAYENFVCRIPAEA